MDTEDPLHEEVFEAVHRWWRAWAEKDLETIERMLSPEYVERSADAGTRPVGAGELIQQATRYCQECSISTWELDELVAKVLEHAVMCSYRFRISGTRGAHRFVYEGRATDVLTKQQELWILVAHDSKLEEN